MKKMIVLLLVVGFLIGTSVVLGDVCGESLEEFADFYDDYNGPGNPSPCGEEGSGGGGTPG
jgi:hypothetical protein